MCSLSSSCHIAHDEESIALLKKDLTLQNASSKQVQEAINFPTSDGMRQWYQNPLQKHLYAQNLIDLLSDKSIQRGLLSVFLLLKCNKNHRPRDKNGNRTKAVITQ